MWHIKFVTGLQDKKLGSNSLLLHSAWNNNLLVKWDRAVLHVRGSLPGVAEVGQSEQYGLQCINNTELSKSTAHTTHAIRAHASTAHPEEEVMHAALVKLT